MIAIECAICNKDIKGRVYWRMAIINGKSDELVQLAHCQECIIEGNPLPCYCGGTLFDIATKDAVYRSNFECYWYVQCVTCGIATYDRDISKAMAVKTWNKFMLECL